MSDKFAVPARSRRDLRASLLLGLLCLLVYNANLRVISAGDAYPARYLPFAIWRYHTLALDPILTITAQGRSKTAFWIARVPGGHAVSFYPVVVPVLVAPLYLPAVVYLHTRGWAQPELERAARVMEKLSASLLAAMSVVLFHVLMRRRAGPASALLLTLAFAFGTDTWVISSQALWQHGLAELLVVATLLLLTGPCSVRAALAAGLLCGLIVCNRLPDSILAAALGIYGLWWARRLAPWLVAAATVPVGLMLVYNLWAMGRVLGGYGSVLTATFFRFDLLTGVAGMLVSPTRGVFVFSPFLFFLPFCLPQVLRDRNTRGLTLAALAAFAGLVLLYAKADWRQGYCWGPRYLTDAVPLLLWMMLPRVSKLRGAGRLAFVSACGAAIAIQAVGAFWYTGTSDGLVYDTTGPTDVRAAWDVRNTPFIVELRHARAPAELLTVVRGTLDAMTTSDGEAHTVAPGKEIELAGWALAGDHTPSEAIVLLDGERVASTGTFLPRPDVTRTLGASDPSGWLLTIPTRGLAAGEHDLAVVVRANDGGDLVFLTERRFTLLASPNANAGRL